MAVTIDDIPAEIKPLWVIDQRLAYHSVSGSGRILDGITYDREGYIEAKGAENVPYVKPITFGKVEGIAPGALGAFGPGIKSGSRLTLIISARREYGLFRRDPTAAVAEVEFEGVGVLEWLGRVLDAIERTTDGTDLVDYKLEGTLSSPAEITIEEAPVHDLTWSVLVNIGYDIQSICRGARSVA